MKKKYVRPQIAVLELQMESLLTTFSGDRYVEGPVGSNRPNEFFDFGPAETEPTSRQSVWDDN